MGFRQRFPPWAGFRGAVSLAAALALPTETASGDPLPGRDTVIAVTFIVILITLLVQGLSMPAIVRWANLPNDPTELDEELLAEQAATRAALSILPEVADRVGASTESRDAVRKEYQERLDRIHREDGNPQVARRDGDESDHEAALRLGLLPAKRQALFELRHARRIDDVILRRVNARIDLEELRLSSPENDD